MTVISPKQFSANAAIRRNAARNAVTRRRAAPANRADSDDCLQWALTALVMVGTLLMFLGLLHSAAAPSAAVRQIETGLLTAAGLLGLGAALAAAQCLARLFRPPDRV